MASSGQHQFLFKEMTNDIPSIISEKEMIVQLYLNKPLLLDNLKFDLKVYVIIFGNPLQAFLCDEGIARFCMESYKAPRKSNYKN